LKQELVFVSHLPDGESFSITCSGITKNHESRIYFVVPEGDSCLIKGVDSNGKKYLLEINAPKTGAYGCFINGEKNCSPEEIKQVLPRRTKPTTQSSSTTEVIEPGLLTISSVEESKVFIDGKFVRNAPIFKHKLQPGEHRIHLAPTQAPTEGEYAVQVIPLNVKSGISYTYQWSFSEKKWLIRTAK
jgi:hypothetical protein